MKWSTVVLLLLGAASLPSSDALFKKKREDEHRRLMEVDDDRLSQLQAQLDDSHRNSQRIQDELSSSQNTIASLQADLTRAKQQGGGGGSEDLEEQLQNLVQEHAGQLSSLRETMTSQLSFVTEEKDAMIAGLEASLEEAQQKAHAAATASSPSATTEGSCANPEADARVAELEQANAMLQAEVDTQRKSMNEQTDGYQGGLKKKEAQIAELKAQVTQLKQDKLDAMEDAKEAEEELEHWRLTYSNRTYCNTTHIKDDLVGASVKAYNKTTDSAAYVALTAAEKTKDAAKLAHAHGSKLLGHAKVHAGVGYESTRVLASKHYEQHWPTVEPHYNKHINPVVEWYYEVKAREFDPRWKVTKEATMEFHKTNIDPHYQAATEKYNGAFTTAAQHFGTYCHKTHKFIGRKARESQLDFDIEGGVGEAMEYSCQEKELSLTWIARVLILVITWPLIKKVFRMILTFLATLWDIYVAVTPLRFFIRRSKTTTPTEEAAAAKKNGSPNKRSPNKKKNGSKATPASQ